MNRRDRTLAVAGLALLVLLAVIIGAVVIDAQDRGRGALEDQRLDQIETLGRSMDSRVQSAFGAFGGILNFPYELTPGSDTDQAELDRFQAQQPTSRTGSILLDVDGRITAGTLLLDDDVIGERWEREGIDTVLAGAPAVLPVAPGITTNQLAFGIGVPIPDQTGAPRGAFVFEAEVTADGAFNAEVSALGSRGGRFYFIDQNGSVVASSDPSLLGTVDDNATTLDAGFHRGDGEVVAIADVPSAGWRAVFRQDAADFEAGLSERLQFVLLLVAAAVLVGGGVILFGLLSRLRVARDEQRRLAELNETREEFISIVSHELRTPVAGVLGFLQTSVDHWETMSDDERRSAVERANANARRLQVLTRDVLDAAAVERGELSYRFGDVDLVEELGSAVTAMRDLQPTRTVGLSVPDGPVVVRGDADRLLQVLMNLFDNAVNSSPPEGTIDLRLVVDSAAATVSITDRGAGLSASEAGSMFEKFVRGRSTTRGSGLGLYLVREIVAAHSGTVWGEPAAGGGTTFAFRLPLASTPAPSPTPAG